MGALHHSEGKYDQAWEAWTLANQFERAKVQVDIARDIKAMNDIQAAFADLPDRVPAIAPPATSPAPIFVVGVPRSGTSLTEQIIASDRRVHAMGETMYSRVATWPVGNLMAADIKRASGAAVQGIDWSMMGAVYRKLTAIRSQNAGFVTDKGAILHLFIGALARSLPEARFIWVRRDPRDVTLSAYRSNFTGGAHWRHNVQDAADFLKAHDKMMSGWQAMMPDRILKVEYEALVRNPAQQIPHLMTFLGLAVPDTEALAFSKTTVATASFAQIRGRISPKSIGGWTAYKAHFPDHIYEGD